MIYLQDSDFTLHQGDVLDVLREMPSESVDCVITSPPYWGLRDYGTGAWDGGDEGCDHAAAEVKGRADYGFGAASQVQTSNISAGYTKRLSTCPCGATRQDAQLGLEPTPEQYVERMTEVFREVRRVLAAHGTCWVNMGDSYANATMGVSNNGQGASTIGFRADGSYSLGRGGSPYLNELSKRQQTGIRVEHGLKHKDLCGIPWRLAFALQADGWYLRSDIVWSKPNPMPESVTDRPTKAHEYVFLLTKSPRYFFDQEAVREQFEARPQQRLTANVDMPLGPARVAAGVQQGNPQGGKHVNRFAVVNCGCPEAGCGATFPTAECGCACHVYEAQQVNGGGGRNIRSVWEIATQPYPDAHFATFPEELVRRCLLAGCPEQGTVLDPFMGSGTTALVARKHGRQAVGIELNAEYCELIVKRTQQLSLLSELA